MTTKRNVQSVERAITLLEILANEAKGLNLSEIADKSGQHASTSHRLLATLAAYDYVHQDPYSKAYMLGSALIRLGTAAQNQLNLVALAQDIINNLADSVGELVNVVVLEKDYGMYLAQARGPSSRIMQLFTKVGARVPLHCTAAGKSILAHLPEEQLNPIIGKGLSVFTKYTISDEQTLIEELVEIRKTGFATDLEERELGVRCVASPIRNNSGFAVAAISISGPSGRIKSERISELGCKVRDAAEEVSRRLGFREVRNA